MDVTSYATLRDNKNSADASSCSAQKDWSCWYSQHLVRPRVVPEHLVLRGCLRAFALERAVQQIRSLFELEGTSGRYTTRAKLCHFAFTSQYTSRKNP